MEIQRQKIDPFDIYIDPTCCLRVASEYSEQAVAELAKHIDEQGQLMPVKVRPAKQIELRLTGCHFVMPHDAVSLTDGARRVLAIRDLVNDQKRLGITPNKVVEADVVYA